MLNLITPESRKEKEFLEFNKNDHTAYTNLWYTMKTVLRGKFISLNTYIKEVEKSHNSNPTTHLKAIEQKEADSIRRSKRQEIIKLRVEINKIETKKSIQMKQKASSLRKSTRQTNFIQLNTRTQRENI